MTRTEFDAAASVAAAASGLLVVVDNRVYDLTRFRDRHPGGSLALDNCHGTDASVQFSMYHPAGARKYLEAYCIAELVPAAGELELRSAGIVAEYFALRDRLQEMGLFKAKPLYHLALVMRILGLLTLAVACVLWLPASDWVRTLAGGVFLGLYWQQLAFIGHDLGHSSVTSSRLTDQQIGAWIGDALLGISIGWWKLNHNTHHLVTNSVADDPDIQHMPLFAVTDEFFSSPLSNYYKGKRQPCFRAIMRVQHLLFYPVMLVARFYLYVRSFEHLLGLNLPRERRYLRLPELAGMVAFFVWVLALAWQLPEWPHRLAFLLVSHAVSGLLHVQICISHFPMAVCDYKASRGELARDDCAHFIASQVASTMDVDCHPWLDWLHGGLQHQLEHHLFPRMPRQHLRSAVPHVRDFCGKHGLAYTSLSFLAANRALYIRLRDVASLAADWHPKVG